MAITEHCVLCMREERLHLGAHSPRPSPSSGGVWCAAPRGLTPEPPTQRRGRAHRQPVSRTQPETGPGAVVRRQPLAGPSSPPVPSVPYSCAASQTLGVQKSPRVLGERQFPHLEPVSGHSDVLTPGDFAAQAGQDLRLRKARADPLPPKSLQYQTMKQCTAVTEIRPCCKRSPLRK